jgi:hypothetical protein
MLAMVVTAASKGIPILSMSARHTRNSKSEYQDGQPPRRNGCQPSRKGEPRAHDVDLFHALQFVRIHQTLKITPAMAANVTDKLWKCLIWWRDWKWEAALRSRMKLCTLAIAFGLAACAAMPQTNSEAAMTAIEIANKICIEQFGPRPSFDRQNWHVRSAGEDWYVWVDSADRSNCAFAVQFSMIDGPKGLGSSCEICVTAAP